MNNAIPAVLCLIFRRALIGKADDRVVKVQAIDLLTAFGPEKCKQEFGFEIDKIEAGVQRTVDQRLSELQTEIEELEQYAAAGFADAHKMLKGARKELEEIRIGKLRPKPLVKVLVGKLRKLIAETDNQQRQQEPQVVNQPVAVIKAKESGTGN